LKIDSINYFLDKQPPNKKLSSQDSEISSQAAVCKDASTTIENRDVYYMKKVIKGIVQ
jgi:hypothetical protein